MRTRTTHLMLERIGKIHQKIKTNSYPNQISLAREFAVSIPTISRDIEFMKTRLYAPIEYDRAHNGYYYTKDDFIPDMDFSEDKLQVLMTLKTLLSCFSMTPFYEEVKNVLEALTSNAFKIGSLDIINRIALPPRTQVPVKNNYWYLIMEAMEQNSIIEFDYQSPESDEPKHRRVRPYQILIDDGACYVFGYSEERQAERTFAFSRMSNPVLTKDKFELPDDYDYSSRCGGSYFGLFSSGDKQEFSIKFYGYAKQVIRERTWGDDQRLTEDSSDDSLVLTFSSAQEDKVLSWVLGYGSHALPIAPQSFVNKWQTEVDKMRNSF